jgi:CO/xanthine dehydrogenase FAD-binding subunit
MGSNGSPATLIGQRSRSRIRPFLLHRPLSGSDAVATFEHSGGIGKAVYMAGGLDLIDHFKGGSHPPNVVHLAGIASLKRIEEDCGDLVVGAGVTHGNFAADDNVARFFPDLAREWRCFANPRIRAVGTLGGNIMAAHGSYDAIAVVLATDADLSFITRCGSIVTRKADESPDPSDLLADIRIRKANGRRVFINRKFRPVLAFALASYESDSRAEIRLAVSAGFARPAVGKFSAGELIPGIRDADAAAIAQELVASLPQPLNDWRASANYRAHLLKALVKRDLLSGWGRG